MSATCQNTMLLNMSLMSSDGGKSIDSNAAIVRGVEIMASSSSSTSDRLFDILLGMSIRMSSAISFGMSSGMLSMAAAPTGDTALVGRSSVCCDDSLNICEQSTTSGGGGGGAGSPVAASNDSFSGTSINRTSGC